jgi:FixJ family two-component response regulator
MLDNGERTVVVVDDDESIRLYLSETLASGGYGCQSFANGAARWSGRHRE